jgi:hypothetical protein|tara:strand:- start:33 stop:347 length:315 start_codon:yes stop_codon:yes gene_type:complete
MQEFKVILETLENASHIKKIILFNKDGEIEGTIENIPGSLGSIKLYNHLFLKFGGLSIDAALEGVELYSEYIEEAKNYPGKHPNIDRLFNIINKEEALKITVIK